MYNNAAMRNRFVKLTVHSQLLRVEDKVLKLILLKQLFKSLYFSQVE
ncbi:hypothetical protein CA11_31710 [Gimesia maris]|nr:hypothetical protein CA11_31710 [Gimesia maris]